MEIQIDVLQLVNGERRLNCSAKFVMAARNSQTKSSYTVPKLNINGEKEIFKIIYELGEQRQLRRK
jgi:hypothetical protein